MNINMRVVGSYDKMGVMTTKKQIEQGTLQQNQDKKFPVKNRDTYIPQMTTKVKMPSSLDKGTASHTTIQVDRSTFDKISNYTTYSGEVTWEELGKDGNKRWIVVNGQRFECELSEQEKAMMKNAQKTLIDYMEETEEERKKLENKQKVDYPISDDIDNEKLKNLKENTVVVNMLDKLSKAPGGINLYV